MCKYMRPSSFVVYCSNERFKFNNIVNKIRTILQNVCSD